MNSLYVISFLNELQLIYLYTCSAIVLIQTVSITLIILFNINHLFADREMVTSVVI